MYRDRWITCGSEDLRIRGYYFPWGTKRIAYSAIRSLTRADIGLFTGRGRIWGTANPRYWASLDPGRPRKTVGFVLDVGAAVRPFLTPDDPAAFEGELRGHLPPGTIAQGSSTVI
jgi:hypothetical protein